MEFLSSFVTMVLKLQNDSRTTRGKKSTQFLKGTAHDQFSHILETKNIGLTFFKFQSILTYPVSGQRH